MHFDCRSSTAKSSSRPSTDRDSRDGAGRSTLLDFTLSDGFVPNPRHTRSFPFSSCLCVVVSKKSFIAFVCGTGVFSARFFISLISSIVIPANHTSSSCPQDYRVPMFAKAAPPNLCRDDAGASSRHPSAPCKRRTSLRVHPQLGTLLCETRLLVVAENVSAKQA